MVEKKIIKSLKGKKIKMALKKHGWYGTPEYQAWVGMKSRCYNENMESYPNYGGRGITVCKRWKFSFENFIKDMGKRPSKNHSLDRINPNKNYTPLNCRWATNAVQQRNKTSHTFITFEGVTMPQISWLEKYEIPKTTFTNRLARGWDIERALKTPIMKEKRNSIARVKVGDPSPSYSYVNGRKIKDI